MKNVGKIYHQNQHRPRKHHVTLYIPNIMDLSHPIIIRLTVMASNIVSPLEDVSSWIPEGYLAVNGPNNQCYVVPDFFVAALHQNLDAQQEKCFFDFGKAAGTVSLSIIPSFFCA
jgi:hypothetical protein